MPSPTNQLAIGVDIGGTKIKAALLDLSSLTQRNHDAPIATLSTVHTIETPDTPEAFVAAIATTVKACIAEANIDLTTQPLSVGIATAGIVNHKTGEILGSTGNLPAITYHPFPLGQLVSQATGLSVHVENDANAAAYGEATAGAARGHHDVTMITLGTGVGCGLIINGKLLRGNHFTAGEAGHMRISLTNDRRCTCSRIGCWEIYASGTGLATTGRRELVEISRSVEAQALLSGKDADELTTHDIVKGYAQGNPVAIQLMDKWHFFVATGLGNLMNVLDPQVVVIGGGMSRFIEMPRLKRYLDERVMGNMSETPIRLAELGNDAGYIGAAQLALLQQNSSVNTQTVKVLTT
jgi:glucokinase